MAKRIPQIDAYYGRISREDVHSFLDSLFAPKVPAFNNLEGCVPELSIVEGALFTIPRSRQSMKQPIVEHEDVSATFHLSRVLAVSRSIIIRDDYLDDIGFKEYAKPKILSTNNSTYQSHRVDHTLRHLNGLGKLSIKSDEWGEINIPRELGMWIKPTNQRKDLRYHFSAFPYSKQ